MRFPHEPEFAYRRLLLQIGVVSGAIGGAFWPGLELPDRILAPFAIVIIAVIYYFLAIDFVRFNALLSPSLRKPSAYILFYGAVVGSLVFPLIVISDRHDLLARPALMQALTIPGFVPVAFAAAAGAFRELHDDSRAA